MEKVAYLSIIHEESNTIWPFPLYMFLSLTILYTLSYLLIITVQFNIYSSFFFLFFFYHYPISLIFFHFSSSFLFHLVYVFTITPIFFPLLPSLFHLLTKSYWLIDCWTHQLALIYKWLLNLCTYYWFFFSKY